MTQALVCPFCRQGYEAGTLCLNCEIALVPSSGAGDNTPSVWPDDYVVRPLADLRNLRGIMLATAGGSLLVFGWAPWLHITAPYLQSRSGYDLASGTLGWLWGGAFAWLTVAVLVASRRSPFQMRKLRPLLLVLSAMTVSELGLLLAIPPTQPERVQFVYHFGWGLFAALGLALLGCGCSFVFGGIRHREATTRAKGLHESQPPIDEALH